MKRKMTSSILVVALLMTMIPNMIFAADDKQAVATVETETIDAAESVETTESTESTEAIEATETVETTEAVEATEIADYELENQLAVMQMGEAASQSVENAGSYSISTNEELSNALNQIATSESTDATIVLQADVQAPTAQYLSTFGVAGKHITVSSAEGEKHQLDFSNRGILMGDCTFDNIRFTGSKLYCNGYRTIFTENCEIDLSQTLYGGGYMTTVDSTYVVIAGSGKININSVNGTHNVIGGSYKGSVTGDTYLEITGNVQFKGGNHITPGCVMGDGTSGDSNGSPDVYVGGTATLVYDNSNAETSPAIEGTYGCEMKGNVILDIRSGRTNEICGQYEYPEKSVIDGDLHIMAGAEKYENTDRTLRLNSNWPITGAGNRFAAAPYNTGYYEIKGNVVIDTFENVWGWDKGTDPSYDIPEIYGAIHSNVDGDITINVNKSHMENITGAWKANVNGNITVNAKDVELKNSYYETRYDEGDILVSSKSNVSGTCIINLAGGDVNIVRLIDEVNVNEGSQINITGSPKIRTGVLSTVNYDTAPVNAPVVTLTACNGTIPFIQSAMKVRVTDQSDVTLNGLWLTADLTVDEDSILNTNDDVVELEGSAAIEGTWEQFYDQSTGNDYDSSIAGSMTIGKKGQYISHGSTCISGNVKSEGLTVLMKPSYFQSNYSGTNAELRLPAVQKGKNYNVGTIPLRIGQIADGNTTVNIITENDWNILQKPALGDNYILTEKKNDMPEQSVFMLGNDDALKDGLYLKRTADAAGTEDHFMWQIATGVTLIFDKNGGDTEADPHIVIQNKVSGKTNHFSLPTKNPMRSGYTFTGWNTKADGTGTEFTADTEVSQSMTVYAKWKPDATSAIEISPMDITIYVGGEGCEGVIGEDGKLSENDLPEAGFYLTLPDEVNELLGSSEDDPVNLSGKLELTYDDNKGTTRSWSLVLYGDETMSHVMMNGRHVYIYKLLPSQVDGTKETVPIRMQFTRADGSVMVDSYFPIRESDQFRDYMISFFPGELNEQMYQATFTTKDGRTIKRPIRLGTGNLKVRGNTDESYREISTIEPAVDDTEKGIIIANTAQSNTQYYLNNEGIRVDPAGVKLMVDHCLNETSLTEYIDQNKNTEGKYSYRFRYLDLVDTNNGNAYVSMGAGQKMNIYWPIPSDASKNSEFHIIHFKGLDRDSDVDVADMLKNNIPEELTGEIVEIDGEQFIKFATESFSPFALLYEKDPSAKKVQNGTDTTSNDEEKITAHSEDYTIAENNVNVGERENNQKKDSDIENIQLSPKTGDSWTIKWITYILLITGVVLVVISFRYNSRLKNKK